MKHRFLRPLGDRRDPGAPRSAAHRLLRWLEAADGPEGQEEIEVVEPPEVVGVLRQLCARLEQVQGAVFKVVRAAPGDNRRLLEALLAQVTETDPLVRGLVALLAEPDEEPVAPGGVVGDIRADHNRGIVTGHGGRGVVAGGDIHVGGSDLLRSDGLRNDGPWGDDLQSDSLRGDDLRSDRSDHRAAGRDETGFGAATAPEGGRGVSILFLGANPTDSVRLRIDEEVREVGQMLRAVRGAVRLGLAQRWAVRTRDLGSALLEERPAVVHFCGHGTARGLLFEDSGGRGRPVSGEILENLFRPHRETLRCVVLNACYSEAQAEAIARVIDCVVGMEAAVSDRAAIHFARGFYQALAYGAHLEDAFEAGQAEVTLEVGEGTGDVVRLLTPRIDADQIRLV